MPKSLFLSIICSVLISSVSVSADCINGEDEVIYALETSDVACVDGVDCILDSIEESSEYPWGDAAL